MLVESGSSTAGFEMPIVAAAITKRGKKRGMLLSNLMNADGGVGAETSSGHE